MNAVLIESDWNLKDLLRETNLSMEECINRIRLEFKDEENGRQFFDVIVLIESDWNLKQTVNMAIRKKDTVLIESDWNLKLYESNCFCNCEIVLIESDWNLKGAHCNLSDLHLSY